MIIRLVAIINSFSEERSLNGCNISGAKPPVEDYLQLSFRYVAYQTLVHLSYSF